MRTATTPGSGSDGSEASKCPADGDSGERALVGAGSSASSVVHIGRGVVDRLRHRAHPAAGVERIELAVVEGRGAIPGDGPLARPGGPAAARTGLLVERAIGLEVVHRALDGLQTGTAAVGSSGASSSLIQRASSSIGATERLSRSAAIRALLRLFVQLRIARTAVVAHHAFRYFENAYGLTFFAPQGMSTESEASAANVAGLIDELQSQQVCGVCREHFQPTLGRADCH